MKERIISIFGSAAMPEDHPDYAEARMTGRRLAEEGFTVASGGYGGIMEAVSRGAKEGGGTVIGVTCGVFTGRGAANAWVDREIFTATLFERIETVINLAEGFMAFPGGPGTLAEVAVTWNLLQRRAIRSAPLILVGPRWLDLLSAFGRTAWVRDDDMGLLRFVANGSDAVREILDGNA